MEEEGAARGRREEEGAARGRREEVGGRTPPRDVEADRTNLHEAEDGEGERKRLQAATRLHLNLPAQVYLNAFKRTATWDFQCFFSLLFRRPRSSSEAIG
jgi:hypothetical protein